MELRGIHHVTAITSNSEKIHEFFTDILGMRLVKKTINQDDIQTYHLFYADDQGNAGSDMTFFDFKGISKGSHENNEIRRTSFRVKNDQALNYWLQRLNYYSVKNNGITSLLNKKMIKFEDFDGQLYSIISDEDDNGISPLVPYQKSPVPNEYGIRGLGPIFLSISNIELIEHILINLLNMRKTLSENKYHLYEMDQGGNGGSIIVHESESNFMSRQGYGSIHHVAFRVKDKFELNYWKDHFDSIGASNSGHVDRFYFESVYTRMYPNILFELATDGPGFEDNYETYETLGQNLALPPKFENHQDEIKSLIKPINTPIKKYKKEYFENGKLVKK